MSVNKQLKVLMINYEFPPIGGGGGTTTRFLAKYMVRLGLDVSVITAKPGNENTFMHPDGFKIHYVGPTKKNHTTTYIKELTRFMLTTIYYSKKIISSIQPDINHCFFSIPCGAFGLYCKKGFNIPYITSTLGADVPGFNIGDRRLNAYHFLTQGLTKAIWNHSSYVVANSSSLKSLCEEFSPNLKLKYDSITNGVDTDIFYPINSQKKINQNEIKLLYVSRLSSQKGIETLIKACGILKNKQVTNFKLTVVGDGPLRDKMFALIHKLDIKDKVDFIGWKTLEELPDIYRNSDIFILPSVMEGMPSVVLQAMACSLPIIASRVKGFEEVMEENVNGLTAEYNNETAFANTIEQLIKSPDLLNKMSKNSFEKSKQFSWDTIAKKYLELYEKVINDKSINNKTKKQREYSKARK